MSKETFFIGVVILTIGNFIFTAINIKLMMMYKKKKKMSKNND